MDSLYLCALIFLLGDVWSSNNLDRKDLLPVIYTQGSHYEVGHNIGSTFKSNIQDYLNDFTTLKTEILPLYNTTKGKGLYNDYLKVTKKVFPQYIRELQGIADGAQVSFHLLFLMHLKLELIPITEGTGCTDILVNIPGKLYVAHNEDADQAALNRGYVIHARIHSNITKGLLKVTEEEWTSYSYPGHLGGFTMGSNANGFTYTIDIICPLPVLMKRVPKIFLTRALLTAKNLQEVETILTIGVASGISVNARFLNEKDKVLYNIEVLPDSTSKKSKISVTKIVEAGTKNLKPNEVAGLYYHFNKYNRFSVDEDKKCVNLSRYRMDITHHLPRPQSIQDLEGILGHETEDKRSIYLNSKDNEITTLISGIFDFMNGTWSLYTKNTKNSTLVLPIYKMKATRKRKRKP